MPSYDAAHFDPPAHAEDVGILRMMPTIVRVAHVHSSQNTGVENVSGGVGQTLYADIMYPENWTAH